MPISRMCAMPRNPRPNLPDTYYHIIVRGNAQQDVFLTEGDRKRFLALLRKYSGLFQIRILVWCLMTNHIHLLAHTKEANLSVFMQRLLTSYSMGFNLKNKRTGHLFQSRFKSLVVDAEEYLVELSRYIHLNPVRAGLAASPGQWRWSSLHAYAGLSTGDEITETSDVLSRFGRARKSYLDFVLAGIGKEFKPTISEGMYLAGKAFVDKLLKRLKGKRIEEASSRGPVRWEDAVRAVGKAFGLSPGYEASRRHANSEARRAVAYVARERLGMSLSEIGGRMGLTPSGIHRQVNQFDQRLRHSFLLARKVKKIKV